MSSYYQKKLYYFFKGLKQQPPVKAAVSFVLF